MITSKYINFFIVGILVVAMVISGLLVFLPNVEGIEASASQPQYVSKLFNKNEVISIDIKVDETEWQEMLDNATQEQYISADVIINGHTVESVGIRPKGNSSLSTVAQSDSDRYSFKIEFDHYIDGQNYLGLDKMVINNIQSDASYMKEYLSYDLMSFMGVKTPLFAYSNVTVNGENWGFYLAVEVLEESFAQRNFGLNYGMLYKPESMDMGGGMKNFAPMNNKNAGQGGMSDQAGQFNPFENNRPEDARSAATGANNGTTGDDNINTADKDAGKNTADNPQPNSRQKGGGNMFGGGGFGGFGGSGGGTDLKYTDDNISSYSNIFDNEVFKGTDEDYKKVIEALKNLNSGTDIERYIDVDATLRYFAANTVLVNLDSYFGSMKHNYYLYEEDGKLTMLPWDYNLAFGGFQSGTAESAVNFPIDTPVSGVDMSQRPMLAKLLEVDEYKDKYHEYLQQIVDQYFNNGRYESTVDYVNTLISGYVKEDPSAFYTYQQYSEAVPMIKEFGLLRAKSIEGQLKGTIPSTTDGQAKASDKLIDASAINLSTLGSQGGGPGGGGPGGDWGSRRQNMKTNDTKANAAQQNGELQGNQPDMSNPPGISNAPAQDNLPIQNIPQNPPDQDGQQKADNLQGREGRNTIPGMGNIPDMDIMMQAMQIIQEANGQELTEEQLTQLGELGLTEEQITSIQQMANRFGNGGMPRGGPGGDFQGRGEPPEGNFGMTPPAGQQPDPNGSFLSKSNLLVIGGSTLFLIAGLIFVVKFKRQKYT